MIPYNEGLGGIMQWLSLLFLFMAMMTETYSAKSPSPIYTYRLVKTYPHDPTAFTQGLIYHQGFLYESTGLYGHSSLRKVELKTGKVLQNYQLQSDYFGEGITLWQDHILQLTWKNQLGFVYDQQTFRKLKTFSYTTEGWGLTHDGQNLIMSDGSHRLYFLHPNTFKPLGSIEVMDHLTPISKLNELEYIEGEIFANIWQSHKIARISPQTGQVLGWIDLSGIVDSQAWVTQQSTQNVLNGIAYDIEGKRLFITGKRWPHVFEIKLLLSPTP